MIRNRVKFHAVELDKIAYSHFIPKGGNRYLYDLWLITHKIDKFPNSNVYHDSLVRILARRDNKISVVEAYFNERVTIGGSYFTLNQVYLFS